ncbi:hypothetical protein B0H63DRAFT_182987 [Podospora didyma]|uniref:Uncharacterized protein n=1 Tax=Podospora didyma TaxID=330526 RepID=A0AAE0TZR7_9PEZI|nr:hypothetical protein B0H63DRAFT_182987 [Podospora didyma]
MTSRNSLSDDWEDVGDDNLSVISLPTSDAAGPSTPASPTKPVAKDTLQRLDTANLEQKLCIRPGPPSVPRSPPPKYSEYVGETSFSGQKEKTNFQERSVDLEEGNKRKVEFSDVAHVDLRYPVFENKRLSPVASFRDQPSSKYNEYNESERDPYIEDPVEELFDDGSRDVDPLFLRKTLQSLHEILDDTIQTVFDLPSANSDIAGPSLRLCRRLKGQVSDLIPIVSGYANVWSTSSRELPLDPGLHGWLSGVRIKVLGLQAEAQRIARGPSTCSDFVYEYVAGIWDILSEYEAKMEEFLPIMQVDFSEFQAQQRKLSFVRLREAGPGYEPAARSAPIDIPRHRSISTSPPIQGAKTGSSRVFLLRRELNLLQDVMRETIDHLLNVSGLSKSATALAQEVAGVYQKVRRKIELILTNDSTWTGVSGGLTYSEFLELDWGCISDFAAQLATIMLEKDTTTTDNVWDLKMNHLTTDEFRRKNHQQATSKHPIDTEQLEQLEVLALVLDATFTPQRD